MLNYTERYRILESLRIVELSYNIAN